MMRPSSIVPIAISLAVLAGFGAPFAADAEAACLDAMPIVLTDGDGVPINGNIGCPVGLTELKVNHAPAGSYGDGTLQVTISNVVGGGEQTAFDWSSNIDVQVVLVKAQFTHLYDYGSGATCDQNLTAPDGKGISHVSFCYGDDGGGPAEECETAADCVDDENVCTVTECTSDGMCVHVAGNANVTCRPGSGDVCDPTEVCDGVEPQCPADVVAGSETQCRAGSGDQCDPDEFCSGVAGEACPIDTIAAGGTVCNPGTGDLCDPDEVCSGNAGEACPSDTVATAGTVCNPGSGDVCDPDEVCSGNADEACPGDTITAAGTVCNPGSGDVCDPAEVCSGAADQACPADTVATAGTVCNPGSGDVCDPDEICSGNADQACPSDTIATAGTVCRPGSGDECNPDELCTGAAGQACPADVIASSGTSCTDGDGFACTDGFCDGQGGCTTTPNPTYCDDGESCTLDACVADANDPEVLASGCKFTFDSNPETNPSAEFCDEICRTAGFWGTHGGTEKGAKNVTGAVLTSAGGCFTVCGEKIANTGTNDADSALEAMCVSKVTPQLQLARQLTAAALNCEVTGAGPTCAGTSIGAIFSACDSACTANGTTGTLFGEAGPEDDVTFDCVAAIDCFNNGGTFHPSWGGGGFCQIGVCDDDANSPCSSAADCAGVACVPTPGNCHVQPLDGYEPTGKAGSTSACSTATKSNCTVLPTGETACSSGTKLALPEQCS